MVNSNYTIMYVSLYCSCVSGEGVGHPRVMSSIWLPTTQIVSLHTNYYLFVFYFTTFIYSCVQWTITLVCQNIKVRMTRLNQVQVYPLINVHHFSTCVTDEESTEY